MVNKFLSAILPKITFIYLKFNINVIVTTPCLPKKDFICIVGKVPYILLTLFVSGCSFNNQVEDDKKEVNAIKALPDTTFGFAKVHITQEMKNGALHEYKQYYFPDGSIAMQGQLVNFKKENWWEEFHANGKLKCKGSYLGGKKQGDWFFYYDTGFLQKTGAFDNDELHGWWKKYNEKNEIVSEGNYSTGKKQGYWISYKNEKKHTEGNYESGEPSGLWKYYKSNGELENTFDFE